MNKKTNTIKQTKIQEKVQAKSQTIKQTKITTTTTKVVQEVEHHHKQELNHQTTTNSQTSTLASRAQSISQKIAQNNLKIKQKQQALIQNQNTKLNLEQKEEKPKQDKIIEIKPKEKKKAVKKTKTKTTKKQTKRVKRESNKPYKLLIKEGKEIIEIENYKEFMKNNLVDGIIRIQKADYKQINKKNKQLTHFNLQKSNHKVKNTYFLPIIEKSGYYKENGEEQRPILNFNKILICECTNVRENVKYEDLKSQDFKNSMKHIQNTKQLQTQIVKRYSKSMPDLTKEEILNLGVAITELKIIGEFTYKSPKNKEKETKQEKAKTASSTKKIQKANTKQTKPKKTSKSLEVETSNLEEIGVIRQGFGEGLLEAGKKDKKVVALTADLTGSVKVDLFKKEFKERFFQFGIAEQNMMSAAAGMCLNDKIPFVVSYAVFNPGRNWDQLRVSVCYSNHNVKIIGGHAGLTTGPDGATHQALEDIAITRVLPNLTVVVPCDEIEAKKATLAIAKHKGACYLRLTREKSINITTKNTPFKIGKANILKEGEDVTILCCGLTVQFAIKAREELLKQNITAEIINVHTIKPLDTKTILKSVKKTNCIVTCEEHQLAGGLGSAVSEFLSQNLPIPQEFVAVQDTFGESGDGYELLEKYGISTKNIINKVKKVLERKN